MSDATARDSQGGPGAAGGGAGPVIGASESFHPGDRPRVDRVLSRLACLGITELRTAVSWAMWLSDEGQAWYPWLLPRLRERAGLVVTVACTPPPLAIAPRSSAPPRDPRALGDFVDVLCARCGDCFKWVELWDEPDRHERWERSLDPGFHRYCDMIVHAAERAHRCGKRVVLGGTSRPDAAWLAMLGERGVLRHVDAVGVRALPALHGQGWMGWMRELARLREAAGAGRGQTPPLWVTSVGHPTWPGGERTQAEVFLEAAAAPAERVYWAAVEDLAPSLPSATGFHTDERDYHLGLARADGSPKLLCRLLEEGGRERVRRVVSLHSRRSGGGASPRATLITGGAGFIGTNLADRLLSTGRRVIVYDNLARVGVERNADYLRATYGDLVDIRVEDVADRHALRQCIAESEEVYHFAAQVAVTTSLRTPDHDRAVNIGGTMAVLEETRRLPRPVPVLFTSTNKVYGGLHDVELRAEGDRYEPADERLRRHGIGEDRPLEFCSPYGCSKGAADQYVLDYARSYRLPTAVLRMSCIYGPHQCGTEDQGWIAHFLMRAIAGEPVTIYGDGRQVRDALYVTDLVDAFLAARAAIGRLAGRAFNMGGGPDNALSLLELLAQIHELTGEPVRVEWGDWRTGDQRWYISDTRAFRAATGGAGVGGEGGWAPRVPIREGVRRLHQWLAERSAPPAIPATPVPATTEVGALAG